MNNKIGEDLENLTEFTSAFKLIAQMHINENDSNFLLISQFSNNLQIDSESSEVFTWQSNLSNLSIQQYLSFLTHWKACNHQIKSLILLKNYYHISI